MSGKQVLNHTEIESVHNIIGSNLRDQAIFNLSIYCGLRSKELSLLLISDVFNLDNSVKEQLVLRKEVTKGSKQRIVYLTNETLRNSLESYVKSLGFIETTDALFNSKNGHRFTPDTMRKHLKEIYVKAGIEGASSHTGRRTFATKLIEQGVDLPSISYMMGHSSINTTMIYFKENPTRLKNFIKEIKF